MSSTPQITRGKAIELLGVMFLEQNQLITGLTKALAKLGCSCTQPSVSTALEAHTVGCRFRTAMQEISV